VKNELTLVTFGAQNPEEMSHQTIMCYWCCNHM